MEGDIALDQALDYYDPGPLCIISVFFTSKESSLFYPISGIDTFLLREGKGVEDVACSHADIDYS